MLQGRGWWVTGSGDMAWDSLQATLPCMPDQALKEAGPAGLDTGALAAAVAKSGAKQWEHERIAKSSCASTCNHDPAFARLEKGRFALRALRPDLEVWLLLLPASPILPCSA